MKKDVKLGGSSINNACEITIQVSGSDIPIDLEEYVIGVVAAEMPVSFHIEALKAQAIAARTYVLKNTNYGQIPIEPTVAKQVFMTRILGKKIGTNPMKNLKKGPRSC